MKEYQKDVTNLVVTRDVIHHESEVIKQAERDGVPIVTVFWVHLSVHLNTILPYEYFRAKKYDEVKHKKVKIF